MKLVFAFTILVLVATASMISAQCYGCAGYSLQVPVCGVNGVTYPNRCYLSCAGIMLAYVGACRAYGGGYTFGGNLYREPQMLG